MDRKPNDIFEELATIFAPTQKIYNVSILKNNILNSLHEEKSTDDIKEIAINWLNVDDLLKAISDKLQRTQDENKIKELENLLWK